MSDRDDRDPDEDRWLRDLGQMAREEIEAEDLQRFDRRWDAYAAGTLAPAQQAALLEEARTSAEGRQATELFRPLDEDFKDKLARRAVAQTGAGIRPPKADSGAVRTKNRLLEWLFGQGGSLWRWQLAGAAAAVVALVGLGLLTRGGALPAFSVAVEPLSSGQRAAAGVFTAGEPLEVHLRPATATRIRPEIRIYLRGEGRIERWRAAEKNVVPAGDSGVLILDTPGWELGPGSWTLFVALGRRGTLPSDDQIRELLGGDPRSPKTGWQLLEVSFVVVPPEP